MTLLLKVFIKPICSRVIVGYIRPGYVNWRVFQDLVNYNKIKGTFADVHKDCNTLNLNLTQRWLVPKDAKSNKFLERFWDFIKAFLTSSITSWNIYISRNVVHRRKIANEMISPFWRHQRWVFTMSIHSFETSQTLARKWNIGYELLTCKRSALERRILLLVLFSQVADILMISPGQNPVLFKPE